MATVTLSSLRSELVLLPYIAIAMMVSEAALFPVVRLISVQHSASWTKRSQQLFYNAVCSGLHIYTLVDFAAYITATIEKKIIATYKVQWLRNDTTFIKRPSIYHWKDILYQIFYI